MASPNLASASSLTKEELMDWSLAEAKGISHHLAFVLNGEQ